MKRKLALAALVVSLFFLFAPALALGFGRVSIYSDAALTECTLSDTSPRIATVYVAESSNIGATGLRFRITESAGFTGTWLSEATPYFLIGTSRTDLSIGYGICLFAKSVVLTMNYQLFGTSTCSDVSIAAAVGFPVPICTGCTFDEQLCTGFDALHINCPGPFNCDPVAVEPTTWGQVKALYRN